MPHITVSCPSAEATKRGLGAALLRKPTKLAKMVAGIAAHPEVDLPITVKIRTGTQIVGPLWELQRHSYLQS